ncbi:molybdate ABC transporter permease subunit [Silicimonas algicola]|uniref:Molybdenum transport system permease n=1 Tax=Silicimonas algicola TaxID=1826607 RepID=A0A316GQE0_9RHOB|nr:molybdate ABC transporter permease subunit [Silicimonas algicola]AZQ67492.1 molybdate ABC transporter permease subunit [Silicimonas algicola]PWK57187.1 molybdate transport system permease protein [Silicimonas algicola]
MSVWPAVFLTLQLAAVTTVILLIIALPFAWWLATTRARSRPLFEAITALPLVLPPTVLGFYLLILMAPSAPLGGLWVRLTGDTLAFSFPGLVLASVIYSFPFAVQPLQTAFASVPRPVLDAARTLGASPRDAFFSVSMPLARRGLITAAVLSFAHTVGEFGVILMVGGNIPGKTRVISIEVFSAVETLDYRTAHILSFWLLALSLIVLVLVYAFNRRGGAGLG